MSWALDIVFKIESLILLKNSVNLSCLYSTYCKERNNHQTNVFDRTHHPSITFYCIEENMIYSLVKIDWTLTLK